MRFAASVGESRQAVETKQLQVFISVGAAGSFSKAAIDLNVTQPMITRHIRGLEEELGVELFYRNGRGVVLTEAGILLKAYADEILERMRLAQNAVANLKSSPRGRLVLGVPPSVGTVLTVPLVKKIKNEFPHVALQVIEGFSGHILEWLIAGRIDAAVLYNSPNHPSVLTEPLADDELFLIGPVFGDMRPPPGPVDLGVFGRVPMILPSRPHGLRRLIDNILGEHSIYPNLEMELEAMPSTLLLVEEGTGFTVLPYASVHILVETGRVSVWPFDPPITRKLILATSSQRPMSSTFRPLFRAVRTELRDIISTHIWKPNNKGVG
jgi:LysR family nitrogen assimilation transcriptional regulator